jgi:ABC-type polysaccharide/polyol phosphate export permease
MSRGALAEIVGDYVHARDLLRQLLLRDLRIRYKQTVMGLAWALLLPIAFVLAGSVIRLAVAHSGGTTAVTSIGAVAIRALCWAFVASGVTFGTQSLVGNTTLVSKIYFPREVLPTAAVLAQGVDALIGAAVVGLALPWFGAQFSAALLWLPVLVTLLFLFVLALALAGSAANLFYRDVKYLVQVGTTIGVFFTPVFFAPDELGPRAAAWLRFNPLTSFFEGIRLVVLDGHNLARALLHTGPDGLVTVVWAPWQLAYGFAWAILALVAASLWFHRVEFTFAERV